MPVIFFSFVNLSRLKAERIFIIFSLVNPPIPVLRDNNLVFGVGHTSLSGYELNIYHDKDYKNEFVSVGNTTNLQVIGVGTVGVTSTATVTLNYSPNNSLNLY